MHKVTAIPKLFHEPAEAPPLSLVNWPGAVFAATSSCKVMCPAQLTSLRAAVSTRAARWLNLTVLKGLLNRGKLFQVTM